MDLSVIEYKAELLERIEVALKEYSTFCTDANFVLQQAVQYSLLAPGKRLRPLLALLASQLCHGTVEAALPAAVAMEMVHAYSLIHDDLPAMDNDDLRRGRPTCHKQFDEATAILAGDALLTMAFEILTSRLASPVVAAQCVLELSCAAGPKGMVGGQQDDLLGEQMSQACPSFSTLEPANDSFRAGKNVLSQENRFQKSPEIFLRHVHDRKTAALIIAALKLGAITAHASESQLETLVQLGAAFGLAFQITDDILDAVGDEATLGKKTQKDAQAHKVTFVTLYGLEESRRRAEEQIQLGRKALSCFSSDQPACQILEDLFLNMLDRKK